MKIHHIAQGTPEWHAHRASHFNASDAPAMMGCSPYKTRTQLLQELATGITADVDAVTQRRFDDGHRFEALARPLAEKIIGEDLYPVTGSEGKLSASFDGLTMGQDVAFEHKTMNSGLYGQGAPWGDDFDIPLMYRVQMEQQLLISGASKCLFMASRWDADNTLDVEQHCWYYPDLELRAKIVAGWAQLEQDLAAFVPTPITVAPVAKVVASLPVVFDMRVQGRLVSCNLEEYKPAALAYIEAINTDLVNDQDFANADADAKFCRDSADKLELAIEQALGQMGDINQALNTVREIAAAFDAKGLALEKLVEAEKKNRKIAIVSEAAAEFVTHINGLNDRLGQKYMPTIPTDFQGVIKGLRSVDSMQDKVATELARAKIAANEMADRIQANMKALAAVADKVTFPDAATLVLKAPDDLAAIVANRVAEADRKAEELRESVRQQEAAKLAAQQPVSAPAPVVQPGPAAATVTHEAVVSLMPASVRQAMAPAAKEDDGARMKLGQINERLAPISLTAEGLAELGFRHVAIDRSAKLYRECDFPAICEALIQHITQASDLQAA